MGKFNFSSIDLKYRIPRTGEYNIHVMDCVNCDYDLYEDMDILYSELVKGFCSDNNDNAMIIIECPKCFTLNRCHCGSSQYHCFLLMKKDEDVMNKFYGIREIIKLKRN